VENVPTKRRSNTMMWTGFQTDDLSLAPREFDHIRKSKTKNVFLSVVGLKNQITRPGSVLHILFSHLSNKELACLACCSLSVETHTNRNGKQ
jgi:hypothetical protein